MTALPYYAGFATRVVAWRERFRAQLLTTVVAQSYGNDNNTADFVIPSYAVWDLTMEADVYEGIAGAYFTVNNLFGADYWARVRSDGIGVGLLAGVALRAARVGSDTNRNAHHE